MIMLKFVDDTGTVEYCQDLHAVLVDFNGSGNFDQHMRTVQAAENMAKVYQTKSFLLSKEKFAKISPAEFKAIFAIWVTILDVKPTEKKEDGGYRISLVTSAEGFQQLSELLLEEGLQEIKNVSFDISTSKSKAVQFLQIDMDKEKDDSCCFTRYN